MKKLLYLFLYISCCVAFNEVNAQSSFSTNPNPPKEKTGEIPQTDAFCSSVVVLSQTQDNSILGGNSISCNGGGLHSDNSYWRSFNLASLQPNTTIEVSTIQIGIETASATSGSQPIIVRLYYMDTGVFPSGTLSAPISTTTHTITNQTLTLVNLPVSVLLQQNRELVVEIFTPNGISIGNSFFIGSNNLPETAPTYVSAPGCGVPNPVTFSSIGSPDIHAVINVVGCVISCNNLTSILASPATVCSNGTTLLTATGIEPNSTVSWYANATTNTVLGTGNTFTTPPLSTATTFFASQSIIAPANDTLNYTGAMQTLTVPPNISKIIVELYGASGADGATGGATPNPPPVGGTGGLGSKIIGELNVTAGQVLNVFVGGAGSGSTGGFNGGGTGGNQLAGGGGGATDIRIGGILPANRVMVAAGGGGGGRGGCYAGIETGGAGGAGSGNGINGGNSAPGSEGGGGGGFGGSGITAGAAGIGCGGFLGQAGINGNTDGQGGNGGDGQTCCCFGAGSIPGGGGGGGGYAGGGGGGGGSAGTTGCSGNGKGGGGGGAGGTNYLGSAVNTLVSNGVHNGNGKVIIKYISEDNCTASTRMGKTINVHPSTFTYVSPTDNISTNQGTKQASQSIHASNTITTTGNVTYKAANAIFLNQNFKADAGSVFKAEIGGCN